MDALEQKFYEVRDSSLSEDDKARAYEALTGALGGGAVQTNSGVLRPALPWLREAMRMCREHADRIRKLEEEDRQKSQQEVAIAYVNSLLLATPITVAGDEAQESNDAVAEVINGLTLESIADIVRQEVANQLRRAQYRRNGMV